MYAPVGKSGPGTIFMISFSGVSGLSSRRIAASTISRKLCGGIFVAMPTAIPLAPLTRRFGMREGRTKGSSRVWSKFGTKSTVSFSRSARMSSLILASRASVYRMAAVDRTEVSLAIDQRVTHVEVLGQAHQSGIDDGFTVRMVIARSVAANLGAFAVAAVRSEAEVIHGHEDAPLHGLEAVAHVGQRASDDHAHRVVEIRLLHLGFDINREQYRLVCFVRHFPSLWLSFQVAMPIDLPRTPARKPSQNRTRQLRL